MNDTTAPQPTHDMSQDTHEQRYQPEVNTQEHESRQNTQNDENDAHGREKRIKVQDNRSISKQNQSSSSSSSNARQEGSVNTPTTAQENTGTKRTSSKVSPTESRDADGEPDAKRARDDEITDMNDASNLTTEVDEFYSVPRIAPRTLGKYVKKSRSFDMCTVHGNERGTLWTATITHTTDCHE